VIGRTAILLVELAVLFVGVAFLVEILQHRFGPERLRRWMGGAPPIAALKGIAVGFVTPFCTFSAIPMLIGLRRAGVTPAGYVAFIVAAPVLDPVLFGALALIVGLPAAIVYVVVAFSAAMTLALVAEAVGIERHLKPLERAPVGVAGPGGGSPAPDEPSCERSCGPTAGTRWRGLRAESRDAWMASMRLGRSLGPVLVLGVAIGLVIEALVPVDFAARVAGSDQPMAIPIAAALGTPLYFSTGLFVPIAESLSNVGVGIGAIVALTIAGAGANIPEFVILGRLAKARLIAVFLGFVFAVAMTGGVLAQSIAV
jgi:uncharacterized membrane protein YraQ (UPF0718 family)